MAKDSNPPKGAEPSDQTIARPSIRDDETDQQETRADNTIARVETVMMPRRNHAAPASGGSNAPIDPDATVETDPQALEDNDRTVLTNASRLDNSNSDSQSGRNKTGATKTIARKYQRTDAGELEVGSVIRERFVIEKLLGSGGMGAVYRALDLRKKEAADNEPYVAIKVLKGNFQFHKSAFITLQREAKKTQALAHPNIITVYDFDRDNDLIFITMEELKGHALNEITKGKVDLKLSYKQRLDIVEQIAEGLSHAHAKGLVHSDLKPANIFLTEDGGVKILDFGIARAASAGAQDETKYKDNFDAGAIGALTAAYASLEMFQGEAPHPSDDVYALGIVACELLHGAHPYDRINAQEAQKNNLEVAALRIKNPFLKRFFAKSVALQRKHRIADAKIFLKKLNNNKKAPFRLTLGALLLVIGVTANALYISSIEKVEKVPFSSLSEDQQELFLENIEEARLALSFGDIQGGVAYVNEAYDIHKTHEEIGRLKLEIRDLFKNSLIQAKNEKEAEFVLEQVDLLKQYPAFEKFEVN